jgi:hypothetical protein
MVPPDWREFLWLAVTTTGLLAATSTTFIVRRHYMRERASEKAVRVFMVRLWWLIARLELAGHVVMVFCAAWGLSYPPPPPDYDQLPQTVMNIWSWIVVSSLATSISLVWRVAIHRMAEGRYDGE